MVNIIGIIVGTLIVAIIGGAIGYWVWLKTRTPKETWSAKVYQLGEGVREPKLDDDGNIISELKLQDLKPYARDVLEKVEKAHGIVVYRLQKLNKSTPAVEGDVAEYWGEGYKEVAVLYQKSGCTLLKKGYDKKTGEIIFDPLPYSRINLIKNEMAIRKDRLQSEKDILQAITPWIVTGICMLGLLALGYILISGFIEMSEKLENAEKIRAETTKLQIDAYIKVQEAMRQTTQIASSDLGKQEETPPTKGNNESVIYVPNI